MEKELEAHLYECIPLTKAMGLKVELASEQKVILSAPFSNNINHLKTIFGGSLHAVASLACWSLLYVNLKSKPDAYDIIITKSEVDYLVPIKDDFKVECQRPDEKTWKRFLKMLCKGKARVELTTEVIYNNQVALNYRGTFAALKVKPKLEVSVDQKTSDTN